MNRKNSLYLNGINNWPDNAWMNTVKIRVLLLISNLLWMRLKRLCEVKSLILPQAKQDIREAVIWYNNQQNGLGKRFVAEVREKVCFIRQFPKASIFRFNDERTAVLNTFPYTVHYYVDGTAGSIVVITVFHTGINLERCESREN